MTPTEHPAKIPSLRTGLFATLRGLLHAEGTGALSRRHVLATLATLATTLAALAFSASPALAAGDANQATCSNEASPGFQTYLPDCRAYEMVSPPFKDGFQIKEVNAVSKDGSHVLGISLGTFAGAESNELGVYYDLSRSASGWVASAINPPASQFPAREFFATSTDLGRTLWGLRGPSQSIYATDLYLREADGAFVKIGSLVPPSAAVGPPAGGYQLFRGQYLYAGASSDLSHVLFNVENVFETTLWPGDTTAQEEVRKEGGTSLYEYVGTGNKQPELVGVNAGGHLISNCTTSLGSEESKDIYNAVSADGETVFFTARGHNQTECEAEIAPEVSELYARLGGIETVAVSEPSPGQCEVCNTAVKMPAEFQGASQDGSKVFFLTEQELLSGHTTENLYEYDFNSPHGHKIAPVSVGSPTPEVEGVARVSQDGSHVYFVAKGVLTKGANAEGREPVAGGENLYVFERDPGHPGGRVAFVATLSKADAEDWATDDERPVQATPDGRFVVFQSVMDLTPGDTSTEQQVFEYDSLKEELARVSIGQAGYAGGLANANANASNITRQRYIGQFSPTVADNSLAVSADGSTVVFSSRGALTVAAEVAAAAGAESVYEYHSAGSIVNGNTFLVSDGKDVNPRNGGAGAIVVGLDASARDIFFDTADPLLAQDVDTQFDLYDARAGGGFPALAVPAGCEGEACQSTTAAAPVFAAPSSANLTGNGNLVPTPPPTSAPVTARPKPKPVKCKRGFTKKKNKCVKNRKKKAQRASRDRRANS